ncbi:SemiSWEET family sugar transporter [Patescibacteria group bacterium]
MHLEIFVTFMGVLMSVGYFPQAYKIWKTKSARDVSLFTYGIFSVGTFVWTLYGVYINDLPIILSFIVGIIGSWLVLGLSLYYKDKKIL